MFTYIHYRLDSLTVVCSLPTFRGPVEIAAGSHYPLAVVAAANALLQLIGVRFNLDVASHAVHSQEFEVQASYLTLRHSCASPGWLLSGRLRLL